MNIKPLYKNDSEILVGLEEDFTEVCILDGLVISLDLKERKQKGKPWSGQKVLRNGKYTPILINQKNEYRQMIRKTFRKRFLADIKKQLISPPAEAVKSLIWKPDRLRINDTEEGDSDRNNPVF